MDFSLYNRRPTLVLSGGPDRVVTNEPADENTQLPRPVGFAYQTTELTPFGPVALYGRSTGAPPVRHVASGTVCTDSTCVARHHRPWHRAERPQCEEPTTYVGKHVRLVTP